MLSTIDFHPPKSWIGRDLPAELTPYFETLREYIEEFTRKSKVDHELLLEIIDYVSHICSLDINPSMKILTDMLAYLRIDLLSSSEQVTALAATLVDALVKNCGTRIHIVVSHKYFLHTLSKVARRWNNRHTKSAKNVANILLDIIHGWGEGFESRHQLYPHIGETYHKLRFKHAMTFPRPQYDPRRVPIFLPPLTEQESQYLHQQQHASDEVDDLIDLTDFPQCDTYTTPSLIVDTEAFAADAKSATGAVASTPPHQSAFTFRQAAYPPTSTPTSFRKSFRARGSGNWADAVSGHIRTTSCMSDATTNTDSDTATSMATTKITDAAYYRHRHTHTNSTDASTLTDFDYFEHLSSPPSTPSHNTALHCDASATTSDPFFDVFSLATTHAFTNYSHPQHSVAIPSAPATKPPPPPSRTSDTVSAHESTSPKHETPQPTSDVLPSHTIAPLTKCNPSLLRSIPLHPIAVRRRQTEIVTTIDTPYRHPAISGYKYDGPMMASDMANRVQYFGTQRVVQRAPALVH